MTIIFSEHKLKKAKPKGTYLEVFYTHPRTQKALGSHKSVQVVDIWTHSQLHEPAHRSSEG